jgi:2-polyprenyl-3-methyl-5-hydroxy-6-metoxy-1,4-benzoquinol methylase
MLLKILTNWAHQKGIKACEQKAIELSQSIPGPSVDVGASNRHNARLLTLHKGAKDFNTHILPFSADTLNLVICEQVIEHLHNTTWFLKELYRILKPDGHLLIATENLGSLPNITMLLVGKAPFSTQPICGNYYGGFKKERHTPNFALETSDPTFSGTHGHVRVLTKGQLIELLRETGFTIKRSYSYMLGHYVLIHCTK